ncbi:hypothetical protein HMPREF0758_2873 [Serratia odorifera DSM 4582]|jgi:hypothetical protein|uniref:Uncharacterized protein n=1 Tax=Serratia odorifera DSM 4582 TaxID=667129 RepID=D4E3X3_SEROD|nr:hypothetical protein HMPREF0758_2873 [Serratia odorifera DSM 4582]
MSLSENAKRNETSLLLFHRQSVTAENVLERTVFLGFLLKGSKPDINVVEITGTNRGLRDFFRRFFI